MNYFFAIPLPPPVRLYVADVAAAWQRTLPPCVSARWYAPEDYHITVKFLGPVDAARLPALFHAAQTVAAVTSPFPVRLTAPGGFPDLRKPFVLWSGVHPGVCLSTLAAAVDRAAAEQGFPPERRPYRPHVTLARCRTSAATLPVEAPQPDEHTFPKWWADGFALMQTVPPESRRNGQKARYNTVHLFPFGTTPSSAE